MNGVDIKNFADFFHGENKNIFFTFFMENKKIKSFFYEVIERIALANLMEKIKEFGDCFHDEKKT